MSHHNSKPPLLSSLGAAVALLVVALILSQSTFTSSSPNHLLHPLRKVPRFWTNVPHEEVPEGQEDPLAILLDIIEQQHTSRRHAAAAFPMPNVTKGCLLSPSLPHPQLYTNHTPPQYNKTRDSLSILASISAIMEDEGNLMSFDGQTQLAQLLLNHVDFKVYENDHYLIVAPAATNGTQVDIKIYASQCMLERDSWFPEQQTPLDCGSVHAGFLAKYLKNHELIVDTWLHAMERTQYNKTLLFTGGSQGGAVALLASLHARSMIGHLARIELVTFAQPELFHRVPDNLEMPHEFVRYTTSYVNDYNPRHFFGYFCTDDVVEMPHVITGWLLPFKHIGNNPIHVPCRMVDPQSGAEGSIPQDYFTWQTGFMINWHCHEVAMYLTRFAYFFLMAEREEV